MNDPEIFSRRHNVSDKDAFQRMQENTAQVDTDDSDEEDTDYGFKLVPARLEYQAKECKGTRKIFPCFAFFHLAFFINNCILYQEVFLMLVDLLLLYLDFYNYRTLSKKGIAIEILGHMFSCMCALSHFQRVFMTTNLIIFVYLVQFFFFYPIFICMMISKMKKLFALHR